MVILTMHKSRMVVCIQSGFIGVTVLLLVLFGKAYSYDCPDNYCGQNCTDICSCKSPLDSQQKANFQRCNGSCLDGWQGERCDIRKCESRYFGFGCRYLCHCIRQCDPWTGECLGADSQCELGWSGPSCQKHNSSQVCSSGIFGPNCESRCYCFNKTACSNDGSCPGDGKCQIGWHGKACDSKCSHGSFGEGCRGACHCSNNEQCDPETGKCPHGCSDGWLNDMCNKQCSTGRFGKDCGYGCGKCLGGPECDPVNGTCSSGCINGWHGPRCRHKDTDDTGSKTSNQPDHEYKLEPNEDFDGGLVGPTQTENNCTESKEEGKGISDQNRSEISAANGILVALVIIVAAVTTLVVLCYVKRKRDRYSKSIYSYASKQDVVLNIEDPNMRDTAGNDNVHIVAAEIEEVAEQIDIEADVLDDAVLKIYDDDFVLDSDPSGPLPLAKLWGRIQDLKRDDAILLKEFASLPIGICDSTDAAILPVNRKKNRYNGVYPYDFNRVKLIRVQQDSEGVNKSVYGNMPSDFINASYFDGYDREKAYIVTQGPLEWTRGDFWEMVWQEGTTQIIMLTNVVENRKIKCCQYWPDDGKAHFGKVYIKYVESTKLPNFKVTHLQIRMGMQSAYRTILHYHYETWPDKDIPDSTWNLVDFWRHVRISRKDSDGPLVVHCSAGVGRSGTYVGLDYLYDQALSSCSVKIFDCVRSMRKQRINMIQTKLQYLYLHEIVAEATHSGSLPVDQQVFTEYVDDLEKTENESGKTHMQIQYENLCEGVALSLSEEQEQIYANNRSVYIKALFLKNYQNAERFLVQQSFYLADDEEFWKNIYDTMSTKVVTFDHIGGELGWLEIGVPKQVGEIELVDISDEPFQRNCEQEQTKMIIKRELSLRFQDEAPHHVHLFEGTFYKGAEVDLNPHEMLRFIDEITEWQENQESKEIIALHYTDDPSCLGPFLVIMSELDRWGQDNKIGIFETVWRFKSMFPNMIPDFQQYQLCYTALSERLKDSATYFNM